MRRGKTYINEYASPSGPRGAIRGYANLYNDIRPHSGIGGLAQARRMGAHFYASAWQPGVGVGCLRPCGGKPPRKAP